MEGKYQPELFRKQPQPNLSEVAGDLLKGLFNEYTESEDDRGFTGVESLDEVHNLLEISPKTKHEIIKLKLTAVEIANKALPFANWVGQDKVDEFVRNVNTTPDIATCNQFKQTLLEVQKSKLKLFFSAHPVILCMGETGKASAVTSGILAAAAGVMTCCNPPIIAMGAVTGTILGASGGAMVGLKNFSENLENYTDKIQKLTEYSQLLTEFEIQYLELFEPDNKRITELAEKYEMRQNLLQNLSGGEPERQTMEP